MLWNLTSNVQLDISRVSAHLTIFRRFPTISEDFPNVVWRSIRTFANILPNFSEDYRRFPRNIRRSFGWISTSFSCIVENFLGVFYVPVVAFGLSFSRKQYSHLSCNYTKPATLNKKLIRHISDFLFLRLIQLYSW